MLKVRPKVCAECRFCRPPGQWILNWCCSYRQDQAPIDVVTGKPTRGADVCQEMRAHNAECGPEGKLWMPIKPIEVPKGHQ